MAKNPQSPRFEVEDFERIFRALVASGAPDPFGRLEADILALAEEFESQVKATEDYRSDAKEERDAIRSRTFGILLLQIFRTIRFFFGLLPQGRMVLIAVAIIGLVVAVVNDKPVTLADLRKAAESTGIGAFLDEVLAEIRKVTNDLATETSEWADIISVSMAQIAGRLEHVEAGFRDVFFNLENVRNALQQSTEPAAVAALAAASARLSSLTPNLGSALTAASNIDLFVTPSLRRIPDQIRGLLPLSEKLVRLT